MKCEGKTVAGKPCGAYAVKGGKLCHRHSGGAERDGRKGGKATSAIRAEIDAVVERCNMLATKSQAKFMNMCLVLEWEGERRYKAIAAYMNILMSLTKESDPTQNITVEYVITPPAGRE